MSSNNYKIWAQNVLPIVFDDYLQQKDLIIKLVQYVNGLVGDAVTLNNDFEAIDSGTIGDLEDLHTTAKDSVVDAINEVEDEISSVKADITNAFDKETINPTNLLNRSAVTFGYYCTDTGAISANASYWYTDYIPVEVGETYTRQRGALTVIVGRAIASTRWISCYDQDKNILTDKGASNYPTSFIIPSGVAYIRLSDSTYMNAENYPAYVKGTTVVNYSDYFAPYEKITLKENANNTPYINSLIGDAIKRKISDGISETFDISSNDHVLDSFTVQDMFDYSIQFRGLITTFNGLIIGHGYNQTMGGYIKITPTTFEYYMGTEASPRLSEEHNLTITDYISVRIDAKTGIKADFTVYTNGGVYAKTNQTWDVRCGKLQVKSIGTNVLTSCNLAYISKGWKKPIHLYGDSYFGVYDTKWTKYLFDNGWYNYNMNGYPGRGSVEALESLKTVLNNSNPEKIIWCMGMNNGDSGGAINTAWKSCVDELMDICASRDIELILATIPNVATVNNTYKNAYVIASGYRYIDFASAVGAASDTTWFANMLSNDGVHPDVQGAIALFNQAISDVPELMQ